MNSCRHIIRYCREAVMTDDQGDFTIVSTDGVAVADIGGQGDHGTKKGAKSRPLPCSCK